MIGGGVLAVLVALLVVFTGCTKVDQTDYCIETRFGKVVTDHMNTGMAMTLQRGHLLPADRRQLSVSGEHRGDRGTDRGPGHRDG
jgi:hypothetical protein